VRRAAAIDHRAAKNGLMADQHKAGMETRSLFSTFRAEIDLKDENLPAGKK